MPPPPGWDSTFSVEKERERVSESWNGTEVTFKIKYLLNMQIHASNVLIFMIFALHLKVYIHEDFPANC